MMKKHNNKSWWQIGWVGWSVILIIFFGVLSVILGYLAWNNGVRDSFVEAYKYESSLIEERLLQSHQGVLTYVIEVSNEGSENWNFNQEPIIGVWLEGPVGGNWVLIINSKTTTCDAISSGPGMFKCFNQLSDVAVGDRLNIEIQSQPIMNGNSKIGKSFTLPNDGELLVRIGCEDEIGCMFDRTLKIPLRLGLVKLALINNTSYSNPIMDAAKKYVSKLKSVEIFKAGNYGIIDGQPQIIIYSDIPSSDLVLGLRDGFSNATEMSRSPVLKSLSDYQVAWEEGFVQHDQGTQNAICDFETMNWGTDGAIPPGVACQNLDELADVIVVINYNLN